MADQQTPQLMKEMRLKARIRELYQQLGYTPEMAEYQMLSDAREWDYLGPSVTAVVAKGMANQEADEASVKKPGKSAPTTPRAAAGRKAGTSQKQSPARQK